MENKILSDEELMDISGGAMPALGQQTFCEKYTTKETCDAQSRFCKWYGDSIGCGTNQISRN